VLRGRRGSFVEVGEGELTGRHHGRGARKGALVIRGRCTAAVLGSETRRTPLLLHDRLEAITVAARTTARLGGFAWPFDQLLDHGLDEPLARELASDTRTKRPAPDLPGRALFDPTARARGASSARPPAVTTPTGLRSADVVGDDAQAENARLARLAFAVALYALAGAALLLPALLNAFPLVMGDTWRYVREADGEYSWASSQFYGYLLRLLAGSSLWLVAVAQAAAAVYVVGAFFRRILGATHVGAALGVALLALTSSVSLFASLVMTDVVLGLGLVAAVTLLLGTRSRTGDLVLLLVVAFATAAHPVAFALFIVLALGALAAVAIARATTGRWRWRSRVGTFAGGVAVGVVALTISNGVVWGTPTPNPHSSVVTFAYLYLHGDLERQLEQCERWDVCELPKTPPRSTDRPPLFDFGSEGLDAFNRFLFDDDESVLWTEFGGPTAFADTARAIVLDHITTDPGAYAGRVASSASEQLFQVRALSHLEWMTRYLGERHSALLATYSRRDRPRFEAGKQFRKTLDLASMSEVAGAFALVGAVAAAGAGVFSIGQAISRRRPLDSAIAASALLLACYVAHAVVVGTSAYPTPRYGGRVAWLLALALWTLAYRAFRAYGTPAAVHRLRRPRVHEDDVAEPPDGYPDIADARGSTSGPREPR
jgi:hypothetical protein